MDIICPKCYSELEADEAFRLGERVTCPACNHTWAHVPSQARALKSALEKRGKHKRQLAAELKKRDKQARKRERAEASKAVADSAQEQNKTAPPQTSQTPGGDALVALMKVAQSILLLVGLLWFLSSVESCESKNAAVREERQAERAERRERREQRAADMRAGCDLHAQKAVGVVVQGAHEYRIWFSNTGTRAFDGWIFFEIKNLAGNRLEYDSAELRIDAGKVQGVRMPGRPGGTQLVWRANVHGTNIASGKKALSRY